MYEQLGTRNKRTLSVENGKLSRGRCRERESLKWERTVGGLVSFEKKGNGGVLMSGYKGKRKRKLNEYWRRLS